MHSPIHFAFIPILPSCSTLWSCVWKPYLDIAGSCMWPAVFDGNVRYGRRCRIKRDSQKLFCDATRDATGAKPGKPQIAAMSRPTQLPQLGHRRSWAWLNFCDAMRCDKRFGVRFWPFQQQSCTKVQELPINFYKLCQTARISWWRNQISKTLSHRWLLLWMVFCEFASHASIADRVASRVASQKSFCESRFTLDRKKKMDAYHGSLPHKYRKKNGGEESGRWSMGRRQTST